MRQEIVMPENTTPGLISLNVPAVVKQVPGIRNSYINLPNFGSRQQFPQEMEFTENVSTIPMKRLVFKEGGVLKAKNGMGGRPTKNSNFEWGYLAKEMAGIGNSLAARMDAKKFLDLSNQKADIYGNGQPAIWNGRGRIRFQTPTMNLVNKQIAANNTIAGMMNTADAQANIAGKLSLAETNSKLFNQGLGMVSQELTNQLNAYDTQRREDDKLTFETANNARQ